MTAEQARWKLRLYYQLWDFCRDGRNPEKAREYAKQYQFWKKAAARLAA